MRSAIIDTDILAYQAAASAEQPLDWGDGLWTIHAFEDDVIAHFESTLQSLIEAVEADTYVLAFSDSTNWRKEVLPTYKSNRAGVRRPMLLKFIREHATANHLCVIREGLEGDDVIGIMMTKKHKGDYIACSLDKDFKTIPGKHYNFGRQEFYEITEDEANYWHLYQTLTGDATDGYSGCPGCGPKTAEKILSKEATWPSVIAAYEKAGLSAEEALTQARVARILRASDFDFKTNKPILWEPQ